MRSGTAIGLLIGLSAITAGTVSPTLVSVQYRDAALEQSSTRQKNITERSPLVDPEVCKALSSAKMSEARAMRPGVAALDAVLEMGKAEDSLKVAGDRGHFDPKDYRARAEYAAQCGLG